jgi:hypothetical protein
MDPKQKKQLAMEKLDKMYSGKPESDGAQETGQESAGANLTSAAINRLQADAGGNGLSSLMPFFGAVFLCIILITVGSQLLTVTATLTSTSNANQSTASNTINSSNLMSANAAAIAAYNSVSSFLPGGGLILAVVVGMTILLIFPIILRPRI